MSQLSKFFRLYHPIHCAECENRLDSELSNYIHEAQQLPQNLDETSWWSLLAHGVTMKIVPGIHFANTLGYIRCSVARDLSAESVEYQV
jgi:hypothetical protein